MRWDLEGFYKQKGGYISTKYTHDWMYITCFDLLPREILLAQHRYINFTNHVAATTPITRHLASNLPWKRGPNSLSLYAMWCDYKQITLRQKLYIQHCLSSLSLIRIIYHLSKI